MTHPAEGPIPVPGLIVAKLVNRRRRLLRLEALNAPDQLKDNERVLVDRALDELCAWAEEHVAIFYTTKSPEE